MAVHELIEQQATQLPAALGEHTEAVLALMQGFDFEGALALLPPALQVQIDPGSGVV